MHITSRPLRLLYQLLTTYSELYATQSWNKTYLLQNVDIKHNYAITEQRKKVYLNHWSILKSYLISFLMKLMTTNVNCFPTCLYHSVGEYSVLIGQ